MTVPVTAPWPRIPCGEASFRRILTPPAVDGKLTELFASAGEHGILFYLLVGEYDSFANTAPVPR